MYVGEGRGLEMSDLNSVGEQKETGIVYGLHGSIKSASCRRAYVYVFACFGSRVMHVMLNFLEQVSVSRSNHYIV